MPVWTEKFIATHDRLYDLPPSVMPNHAFRLLGIITRAARKTGVCELTIDQLCEAAFMSESTVKRLIKLFIIHQAVRRIQARRPGLQIIGYEPYSVESNRDNREVNRGNSAHIGSVPTDTSEVSVGTHRNRCVPTDTSEVSVGTHRSVRGDTSEVSVGTPHPIRENLETSKNLLTYSREADQEPADSQAPAEDDIDLVIEILTEEAARITSTNLDIDISFASVFGQNARGWLKFASGVDVRTAMYKAERKGVRSPGIFGYINTVLPDIVANRKAAVQAVAAPRPAVPSIPPASPQKLTKADRDAEQSRSRREAASRIDLTKSFPEG